MTVGELIEELKKYPQNMPVAVDGNIWWPLDYDEDINHFQDDDGYDVFVPIKIKEL